MSNQFEDEFHGLTYDELDKLIRQHAKKACRLYRLDYYQYGEDCEQELWIYALRVARKNYDPTHNSGASFKTYVNRWLIERANRYCRQVRDGYVNQTTEFSSLDHDAWLNDGDVAATLGLVDDGDLLSELINRIDARETLADLDIFLIAKELSIGDEELAEMTGLPITQITERRRQAQREFKQQDVA